MKKLIYILTLLPFLLQAQDPGFSQYFSSPLTLNPANTGNFDGPFRFALNFRNQWQGVADPFQTGSASFESQVLQNKIGSGNTIAVGLMGFYDRGLQGGYAANYMGTSIGYHLWLDEEHNSRISAGFQAVLANKRIDVNKLSFSNQLTSNGFDVNIPSDEFFPNTNFGYLDWNAGLLFSHSRANSSFYTGFSFYHITQPEEGFLNNSFLLPSRFVIHSGYTYFFSETGSLMSSLQFQRQGATEMLTIGTALGTRLTSNNKDVMLYAGGWIRLNESLIPYLGLLYNNIQFGLSYDIITSRKQFARTQNRSFELSMVYNFRDLKQYKKLMPWY
jgi:type IX secretion system PorP/SprF family membrane protein